MWKLVEMVRDYFRRWRLKLDGSGHETPNLPDRPFIVAPPPPPPPPEALVSVKLTRARFSSSWVTEVPEQPDPDTFVLRTTEPVLVGTPWVPLAGSNVGWDGNTSGGVYTGDRTIPKNQHWRNARFKGFVHMEGSAENCIFEGGVAKTSEGGFVSSSTGCNLVRCSIVPQNPSSVGYWTNAMKHTGGVLNTLRCYFALGVDNIHSGGSTNRVLSNGDLFDTMTFVYPDNDHGPGREYGSPTYWTHNDSIQILSGRGPHAFIGSSFKGFTDARGVTWSGGTWGVGTASRTAGVTYGRPDITLNPNVRNSGYKRTSMPNVSLWSNMLVFSGGGSFDLTIEDCWWDGVNSPSGMFQITAGTGHRVRFRRNKIRLNGWPNSNGKTTVAYWPSGTTLDILNTGADASFRYDDHPTRSGVPVDRRGDIISVVGNSVSVTV